VARRDLIGAAPSVAAVMTDPAGSALKTVLRDRRTRDPVEAANDAAVLASVPAARARRSLGGRS
jgi:hypothetical protein